MKSLIISWGGTVLIIYLCLRLFAAGTNMADATVYLDEGDCAAVSAFGFHVEECKVKADVSTSLLSGRYRLTFQNGAWMELDQKHVRAMAYQTGTSHRSLEQWFYTVLGWSLLAGWLLFHLFSLLSLFSKTGHLRKSERGSRD